jgi:hypothetical protein
MKKTVIVILLVIAGVFLAGCSTTSTTGQETARDTVRVHYTYTESWSPVAGCYGKVTGYAFTTGNATVENVALNFNLVNTGTGTIRDSRPVYIGTMGGGQSVTFESVLDGECLQQYRVDAAVVR